MFSTAWPVPTATHSSGSSATETGKPVAIHVERKITERVHVPAADGNRSDRMLRPARRFVPTAGRDNVRLAVLIDIGHGHRLRGARIDLTCVE